MKTITNLFITLLLTATLVSCNEKPTKDVSVPAPKVEETVNLSQEEASVRETMKKYKDAIQNLTTEGTFELFTPYATVFEQGKVEGTYKDYIDGHLGPELGHFKSFTFSDYEIETTVNLPHAFTTENYLYTIVLKEDKARGTKERTIESKGVATSILEKIDGAWKIIHSHTSFKKLNQ